MSDLSYHLESENRSSKNYLALRIASASKRPLNKETLFSLAATSSEKSALELLIKLAPQTSLERCVVPIERSFEVLKLLGTTGRVFHQGKKVVVDPFSPFDIYFEARRESPESAQFSAQWKLGAQSGSLQHCDWVFIAASPWILKEGVIRSAPSGPWLRLGAEGPFTLEGRALFQFLEEVDEEEIHIEWKTEATNTLIEPLPFLTLTDRHGGFANLWMDYGSFGKIAAYDTSTGSFRNKEAEKGWEKDLLETDFVKKIVDASHFYCPLDKVAKSLTFLLEMGWTVLDASGRKVLRRGQSTLDVDLLAQKITVRAKVLYDDHEVDIKDLVGAFNRREQFVELSSKEVALIDRQEFHAEWGDLTDQEVTSEGISLRKNQLGLLSSLPLREDVREKISRLTRRAPDEIICPGKDFRGELFAYQKEGLQWLKFLEEGGFGGLLADEMGLGKTVQVLAFFSQIQMQKPCLIIVPTSLVFNWQREFEKFLPSLCIYRHEGKERLRSLEELQQKQIILTSYALLRIDSALFQELNYQIVVLDEAQSIKNPDSQISQCCCRLTAEIRLAITGTPVENRLDDLWSIFRFLQPDLLGDRAQFQASQLHAHSLAKVKKKIRPFILRRTKQHVAIDLPPKLEQIVFVEMEEQQRGIYDRWLKNTQQGLLKKVTLDGAAPHRMEILEAILRLRQLCAHPWLVEEKQGEDPQEVSAKFERLMSDLQEIVSEKQKVLVYSQFTSMLRLIEREVKKRGWKYAYLDGSTKNREETVRQFQEEEEVAIFLISLKAGGVGLNLTAADYVLLYDPWWNEAVERQAIDRAHRLGKVGTVIARRYVTALSIEEKIMRLKEHKMALSHQLLESEEGFNPSSLDDLLELLT